jgi:hypothetical protein
MLRSPAALGSMGPVLAVDSANDGKHIACIRFYNGEDRVEYPAGRTMHITQGAFGRATDAAVAVLERGRVARLVRYGL